MIGAGVDDCLDRHLMELPRKILLGTGVIEELGQLIDGLGQYEVVMVVSGPNVEALLGSRVEKTLQTEFRQVFWHVARVADMESLNTCEEAVKKWKPSLLLGLGGGKSVDLAKLTAFRSGIPFVSVPTCASHDGISSPSVSIKGFGKPYSIPAKPPAGILADIGIISSAPRRLLASGCGDLIAKTTAVKDWELARDVRKEYFGKYAASLARMSAEIIIRLSKAIGSDGKDTVRDVVEALISAGVSIGIAGSTKPCSGSEHLFSHALDIVAPGVGLHGEKVGLGTIMMAKLHGLDWNEIVSALKDLKAPVAARGLGLTPEQIIEALVLAPSIRPERYTILSEVEMNREKALRLAESTGVI